MSQLPTYDEVNAVLSQAKAPIDAAEAHAMICGYIVAGNELDGKMWLDSILGKNNYNNEEFLACKNMLLQLYKASNIQLQDEEMGFELLLPDDDIDLPCRAEALSHWCQGFIIALQQVNLWPNPNIIGDMKEAIEHILEISQLDYEAINMTQEDERAYMEVVEYVRVAVLMVHIEIANDQGSFTGSSSKHLH